MNMFISFIIGALLVANYFVATKLDNETKYKKFLVIIISTLLLTSFTFSNLEKIKAVDAYNNKITLQITEQTVDGNVIDRDSVVILK